MRLIDADAFCEDYGFAERCKDCPRYGKKDCDYPNYSARDFCGWLDDAPTVGGWISVKDRLPERECIAYSSKFDEIMIGYIGETDESDTGYCCESNTEWLGDVTHWMPLPTPPEEVDNDDR